MSTVIVSYECITSLGQDLQSTWEGILDRRSGVDFINRYNPEEEKLRGVSNIDYAGQIPLNYFDLSGSELKHKKSPEPSYYSVATVCKRTLDAVNFSMGDHNSQKVAILGGTALTGQISNDSLRRTNRPYVNFILNQCHNIPLAIVAKDFRINGPSFSVNSACASSSHAVFLANQFIQADLVDCALVVGFEFPLAPVCVGGFEWLNALYKRDRPDDRAYNCPGAASRPFSVDRKGFVLSEGVGAALFCDSDYARKMNWPVKGIIKGGYCNSDGDHLTRISKNNILTCMQGAIDAASCDKHDIHCISAHATSTRIGDEAEMWALYELFGSSFKNIPLVANKSQLGHCLGASGIIQLILATEAMIKGIVPPTINFIPDSYLPESYINDRPISMGSGLTLVNAFGFGGTNVSLVVGIPQNN